MKCPQCAGKTRVLDTRLRECDNSPRRRHQCKCCGHRFSTIEMIVDAPRVARKDPLGIEGREKAIADRDKTISKLAKLATTKDSEIDRLKPAAHSLYGELMLMRNAWSALGAEMHKITRMVSTFDSSIRDKT